MKPECGFSYSWSDLRPIRVLTVVEFVVQLAGAGLALWLKPFPDPFFSFWFGGALSTLPGFLLGLLFQARMRPGSLSANKVMVLQIGGVSAFLSAVAVVMWMSE